MPNPLATGPGGFAEGIESGFKMSLTSQQNRREQDRLAYDKDFKSYETAMETLKNKWLPAEFKKNLYNSAVKGFFDKHLPDNPLPKFDKWPEAGGEDFMKRLQAVGDIEDPEQGKRALWDLGAEAAANPELKGAAEFIGKRLEDIENPMRQSIPEEMARKTGLAPGTTFGQAASVQGMVNRPRPEANTVEEYIMFQVQDKAMTLKEGLAQLNAYNRVKTEKPDKLSPTDVKTAAEMELSAIKSELAVDLTPEEAATITDLTPENLQQAFLSGKVGKSLSPELKDYYNKKITEVQTSYGDIMRQVLQRKGAGIKKPAGVDKPTKAVAEAIPDWWDAINPEGK